MLTKEAILTFLSQNKSYLAQHYGVKKIGLFGSYVVGTPTEDSDIDIAIEFDVKHFLEDHLHKSIDLGIESSLKPEIKKIIKRHILYVK